MKLPTILHTPKWCQYNTANPPPFTIWLNILYACACGFCSANLYYSHPILEVLARDFNTNQAGVANIPTLALAGDATGLLFILPLADFFPRRKFALTMLFVTMAFWLGLCITNNLTIFTTLTYLSALFTGVTQIMIPLVSELSTPEKRAVNISIVAAGPTMAILLARILSGIVANYTSWRNVYWLALGFQLTNFVLLWIFMPDYPSINPTPTPKKLIKRYPGILWSILTLYVKYPVLTQASLLSFCTFFSVSSFWTTLTFLLSGSPYNYNTFIIGLFGLIGAATMVLGPVYSKLVIQPLGIPLLSALIGQTTSLVGVLIGTFAGRHSVAGPAIQALLLDAGLMISQIASRLGIHGCEPLGRNRVNTAFVAILYLGMLTGTKAGNDVYARFGGWFASGGLSVGVIGLSIVVVLVRGPNVEQKTWVGWKGGWGRKPVDDDDDVVSHNEDGNQSGNTIDVEKGPRVEDVHVVDVVDEKNGGHVKSEAKVDVDTVVAESLAVPAPVAVKR